MTDKPIVTESSEYENCLDVVPTSTPTEDIDIFDFLDVEKPDEDNWTKHWVGMPEFVQDSKKSYKTLYVHFRTEEDYKEFSGIIKQSLTPKTKSIWYPELEKNAITLMRWIEDE